jgi:lactoylglutathione lyase
MRILHTMLRVVDLEASIQFYCDIFEMRLLRRQDYEGGRFTLAFLGYSENDVQIELTHNWDTTSYELGNAYGHIAIEVEDAYKACEDIKSKGGNVVREAGPMAHGTTVIAFVKDPDGYMVELIQRKVA